MSKVKDFVDSLLFDVHKKIHGVFHVSMLEEFRSKLQFSHELRVSDWFLYPN